MSRPDPDRVLLYLEADERAVVARWLELLELDADTWPACPPLAVLLPIVAALRAADDVGAGRPESDPLSHGDAVRYGAELLGLEDDPARATHPGDSLLRTLRGWRARGKSFRPSDANAA